MRARNLIKSKKWTLIIIFIAFQLKNNKNDERPLILNGKKLIHWDQQKSKAFKCSEFCERKINRKIIKKKGAH